MTPRGKKEKKKQQIPQEQPPGGACLADVGRMKAWQMDHSDHFQLCIKLDPLPKYGLLTVSNKQLVIASVSFGETEADAAEGREPQTKNFLFVYVCLMNRRLRGGDKAGEDQGGRGTRCRTSRSAWPSQKLF